jgi:hypothetical protein
MLITFNAQSFREQHPGTRNITLREKDTDEPSASASGAWAHVHGLLEPRLRRNSVLHAKRDSGSISEHFRISRKATGRGAELRQRFAVMPMVAGRVRQHQE